MGIQITLVKRIHLVGIVLWNMRMTKLFPDNMAVFTFHQGIIVAVPRPGFSELYVQFFEQFSQSGR